MKSILESFATALSSHVANTPFRICKLGSKYARGYVGQNVSNRETKILPFNDNEVPYSYLAESSPFTSATFDKTRRTYEYNYNLHWIAVLNKDSYAANDVLDSMAILLDSFVFNDSAVTDTSIEIEELTTSYEDIYFEQLDTMPTTANVLLAQISFSVTFFVPQCVVRTLPIIGTCLDETPIYQAETVAFMSAIGSTDTTITNAIDALIVGLKSANLWAKFDAIYPLVGGTIDTVKYNLVNPQNTDSAFRLNLIGGWTVDNNGIVGNGVNTHGNTYYTPATHAPAGLNDAHISIYSRTSNAQNGVDFGAYSRQAGTGAIIDAFNFTVHYAAQIYLGLNSANTSAGTYVTPTTGLYVMNRRNSANVELYRRGTILYTTALSSQLLCSRNLVLGARNDNGTIMFSTNRQYAFASIGKALTPAENATFAALVDAFQTALNRAY